MMFQADSQLSVFFMEKRIEVVNSEFGWRYTTISDLMINEQIRDREVRLVSESGEQLGIMSCLHFIRITHSPYHIIC